MMTDVNADWLAPAPYYVQRLQESLPGDVHVLTAPELVEIAEADLPDRCVQLIWDGPMVPDGEDHRSHSGTDQALYSLWVCVIAVRNLANAGDGRAIWSEAGPLLASSHRALAGYRPPQIQGIGPLLLTTGFAPDHDIGISRYPLTYRSLMMTGA